MIINCWMRDGCTLGYDAPDQFPSKVQFMGGHGIKSNQRFISTSHASHVKLNFSHDPSPE